MKKEENLEVKLLERHLKQNELTNTVLRWTLGLVGGMFFTMLILLLKIGYDFYVKS